MKYVDTDRIWSYLIMSVIGFFETLSTIILWVFIFVLADMIAGMYASLKEGKYLESRKMQKTIIKVIMYATSIILLEGIDKYMITFADCGFAKIGGTIICSIELYSILENFYRATGNKVFKVLTTFTMKKIEQNIGINIGSKRHNKEYRNEKC